MRGAFMKLKPYLVQFVKPKATRNFNVIGCITFLWLAKYYISIYINKMRVSSFEENLSGKKNSFPQYLIKKKQNLTTSVT